MPLFERSGLQQDTGLLKQRWAQQGSTLVNISDSTNSDKTIYTVTAGKKLYINTIEQINGHTGYMAYTIKDGGNLGDIKFDGRLPEPIYSGRTIIFESPLIFETDIFIDTTVGITVNMTGWEEQG